MITSKNIVNAFPLVADALGRRYGVKVHIGGEQAYTDGRNIHIPAFPVDADEATLNLARGYLDHEAAHLRKTDFAFLKEANLTHIERLVWNILEDYCVEKALSELYPGCESNFAELIRCLFLDEKEEGDKNQSPANQIFNRVLFSLRSLQVPELGSKRDKLAGEIKQNYPGLRFQIESVIQPVLTYQCDTACNIRLARKIVRLLQKYLEAQQKAPESASSPNAENKGNESQNEASQNKSGADEKQPKTPERAADDNVENRKSESSDKAPQSPSRNDLTHSQTPASNADCENGSNPSSHKTRQHGSSTDQAQQQAVKSLQDAFADPSSLQPLGIGEKAEQLLFTNNAIVGDRITVAEVVKRETFPLSAVDIAETRDATTALRAKFQNLLQATTRIRNHIGYIGRIATTRIARVTLADPRVFIRHGERKGINTAIHILLDASGSMSGSKIALATRACFAVATALKNIKGVTLAVTAFPGDRKFVSKEGSNSWRTVSPILNCKERLHNRFSISCDGYTPMAEALWWVLTQMTPRAEDRKIILIISDGVPDNFFETKKAIEAHRFNGHDVYGVGIEHSAIENLLPGKYGRMIYDLKELAPAMFKMLGNSLLKKACHRE